MFASSSVSFSPATSLAFALAFKSSLACAAFSFSVLSAAELAISVLGKAPQRIGMPPKRLLIYRTEEPFSKRSLKIETEGNKDSMVEVLGEGQQFVVKGINPKTNLP